MQTLRDLEEQRETLGIGADRGGWRRHENDVDDRIQDIVSSMACVLVVEDDDALREAVVDAIADAGYHVEQAENGRVALDKMRAESPRLVLLDLMMPVMDGWEVVAAMDTDPELANVPVCVVTAQDRLAPPRNVCLLEKPITLATLLDTVGQYCKLPS